MPEVSGGVPVVACADCGAPVLGKSRGARFCVACRPLDRKSGRDMRLESRLRVDRDFVARVGLRLGVDARVLAGLDLVERARVLVELREVEAAFLANPLLGYRPHGPQQRFHAAVGLDLRMFAGGNRSGKTTATVLDSLIQTVDRTIIPPHLLAFRRFDPPFFCRFVTPDLSNTLEGVVLQKIREWCPPDQIRGGVFEKGYDKVLRVLHFKNGSWWQFNSNDQELNKLGGTALHRVAYDEEPRRDIRRECLMRLLDFGGDEVFAMTPFAGLSGFIYEEVIEPWEQGRAPAGQVTVADMEDNPHLPAGEIERVLAGCSDEERQARKSGRFVAFEGLIYKEFDDGSPSRLGRHVVPAWRELPAGDVFVGIDPGIRHMCAVVWVHVGPDDRLTVFDELADGGQTIAAVCRRIHERNLRWGCVPRWFVIDPASRNKNHQTGRSDAQEFAEHGVVCIPGQNSVTAGINRVKERLERDALVVCANCRETRKEFTRYRWSKPKRAEADARESPVKATDHCFPAGTLVATVDGERPIEQVRLGDRVWTRDGLRRVVGAGLTRGGERVATIEVVTMNGLRLRGSLDHPVWVEGRGFVDLDSVRCGDIMLAWESGPRSLFMAASPSVVTPIRGVPRTASTFGLRRSTAALSRCIASFSRSITGRSPAAIMFTMSTVIRPTTIPLTWSASRSASIRLAMPARSGVSAPDFTLTRSGLSRGRGTPLPMGSSGIASMVSRRGLLVTPGAFVASIAATTSLLRAVTAPSGSARAPASLRRGGRPGSMTSSAGAPAAASCLPSIDTRRPKPVRVAVRGLFAAEPAEVYALTVYGCPEFFANGLLVSNCLDALRYVAMSRPLAPLAARLSVSQSLQDRLTRHMLDVQGLGRPVEHPSGAGVFS